MITLKQIAERAGTTVATVSLALRGAPNVSAERKAEIRRIADELGYRRNASVSMLMRHIRRARPVSAKETVALILVHPSRHAVRDFVFIGRRFSGMQTRLAERGYRGEVFWYDDPDCPPARLNRILAARGIRGVALSIYRRHRFDLELDWDRFACSIQNDFNPTPPFHRVNEDYLANTVAALTRLWESGRRRIAVAYRGSHGGNFFFPVTAAYQRFISLAPGCARTPLQHIPREWTEKNFMTWFRQARPDGVLTLDWDIPGWLRAAGVRVPEDVSIAVMNRCPSAPEMSGIDPEPEQLGAMSVDLIIEQLENNETGLPRHPKCMFIPGRWVEGTTTLPPLPARVGTLRLSNPAFAGR